MKRLFNAFLQRLAIKIGVIIQKQGNEIARRSLPVFGNQPNDLTIELPRRLINPERIYFGDNVAFGPGSFLIAMDNYPPPIMQGSEETGFNQAFDSKIVIGNRVTATANLQVAAQRKITIEDDVMFASNVHINDGFHGYDNANIPYKQQKISNIAPIKIKMGSWIGQNVIVFPGVTIGKLCVIGANSVVTKHIPDRCIAVGNPAKIIKKWNKEKRCWVTE